MGKYAGLLRRWVRISCVVFGWLGAATILLMMGSTIIDVSRRFLLSKPVGGVVELNEMLVVWIVFLGLAYVQADAAHVRVDVLFSRLSPKKRAILNILACSVGLALFGLIMVKGGQAAWSAWVRGEYKFGAVPFPLWPSKVMVPIGSSLLCVQLVIDIVLNIQQLIRASGPTTTLPAEQTAA